MTATLSDDLRQALDSQPGQPLWIEDPKTKQKYVLLQLDVFESLQQLIYDDSDPEAHEFLPNLQDIMKADWDALGMEDYDQFNPCDKSQ